MNGIIELISLIVGVVIALFMKDKVALDEDDTIQKEVEKMQIKIEQIGDIYYAWHNADFIVQSKQVEDVLDHIKQKFPNQNFLIVSNKDLSQWLTKN